MCSAKRKELVEVVKYFRDGLDALWNRSQRILTETGLSLTKMGLSTLKSTKIYDFQTAQMVEKESRKAKTYSQSKISQVSAKGGRKAYRVP
jgi:hypothetical protein